MRTRKSYPDPDETRYPKSEKLDLVLDIDFYLESSEPVFPEDVPKLIEYLDSNNKEEAGRILNEYLNQFDFNDRRVEEKRRWEAINRERLEAIQNNQPLPIRPMGIELDMCYKELKRNGNSKSLV